MQFDSRMAPCFLLSVLLGLDFRLFEKTRMRDKVWFAPPRRKWAAFRGATMETESFAPDLDYRKITRRLIKMDHRSMDAFADRQQCYC
jgi:hypothetical protein